MNTQNRLFTVVLGPSGCDKTAIIINMFFGNTFNPQLNPLKILYREMQRIYIKTEQNLFLEYSM